MGKLLSYPGEGVFDWGRKDTGKAWSPHSGRYAGRTRQGPAQRPE
jgi:hypothetical protein